MILDDSSVLPAKVTLDFAEDKGDKDECFGSLVTCSSCPFEDANWTDQDHCYDGDLPEESCSGEWKRVHHDLDLKPGMGRAMGEVLGT